MEQENGTTPFQPHLLVPRILLGAAIGLVIICIFVFGIIHSNATWPAYWRIRPLVVTPVAGATAGLFYHLMGLLRQRGDWIKIAGWVLSILGYFIVLWVGTLWGLAGIMAD